MYHYGWWELFVCVSIWVQFSTIWTVSTWRPSWYVPTWLLTLFVPFKNYSTKSLSLTNPLIWQRLKFFMTQLNRWIKLLARLYAWEIVEKIVMHSESTRKMNANWLRIRSNCKNRIRAALMAHWGKNPRFHKIHISKISIFTKFTFLWNLIFHKIHIYEISKSREFWIKRTFLSQCADHLDGERFETSNSWRICNGCGRYRWTIHWNPQPWMPNFSMQKPSFANYSPNGMGLWRSH